jgi:hypothetical protein
MTSTPTDGWGILAALATSISALVIAWQAIETRRAANQAKRSVDQAKASAEAARDAVDVSQSILRESEISRIDAGVPRVIVTARDLNLNQVMEETNIGDEQVMPNTWFTLPRDANRRLYVTGGMNILNEGPGSVALQSFGSLRLGESIPPSTITLSVGDTTYGIYRATRTVAEWIALAETREGGNPGEDIVYGIFHRGPRDAEATESIEIHIGGTLLERIPNETGNWRASPQPNMAAVVAPAKRTYYRSVSNNAVM